MSDWIPWTGDRPFRGEKLLRVKFKCGKISKDALPAHKWNGRWLGSPYDIEFVRVEE